MYAQGVVRRLAAAFACAVQPLREMASGPGLHGECAEAHIVLRPAVYHRARDSLGAAD